MTLDGGIHHLGTKMIHLLLPVSIMAAGVVIDSAVTMSFAAGMLVVLLFSNMRCRATSYRWRVREAGPREGEKSV